jgi:hypothetical protein
LAESAFESLFVLFVLFTCLKFMIRFLEAAGVRAEILLAL